MSGWQKVVKPRSPVMPKPQGSAEPVQAPVSPTPGEISVANEGCSSVLNQASPTPSDAKDKWSAIKQAKRIQASPRVEEPPIFNKITFDIPFTPYETSPVQIIQQEADQSCRMCLTVGSLAFFCLAFALFL